MNPTTVNEYFKWLEETVRPDSRLYRFAHSYLEEERVDRPQDTGPFLTIVTRTQGKRSHMLTEALLSLTAQSRTDFELLVIGHILNDEQNASVQKIVGDLPEWMRKQTRFLPVNGGTRTTPLNVGFEAARGRYITVLDDDDMVFANWVDEFYQMAQEAPGTILHTYTIQQDWETVLDDIPRAASGPKKTFCKNFELIREFGLNVCPLHSLAFPAYAFRELGIRFDESLTTTEDWDFLLRTAILTGVTNKSVVTSIYRNWLNVENSQTVHSKEEWDVNYERITQKFNEIPIVLPSGTLHKSIKMLTGTYRFGIEDSIDEMQLFYDNGSGFNEANVRTPSMLNKAGADYAIEFSELEALDALKAIRIDPQDNGGFLMNKLKLELAFADGTTQSYDETTVAHNGYTTPDGIAFVKSDPQIYFVFDTPKKLSYVYMDYDFISPIPDSIYGELIDKKPSLPYRAVRFLWRKIRRIFGR